ncbi:MAG: RHS repeat domain-containing protein, partial [Dolichospermum sp.]
MTDPVNNKTIFAYDARNRAIRETSPTGLVTVREYDATNNLTATDKFQIGSINTVNHSDFSNLSGLTLNGDTADVNQTPVVDNNQSVLRLINGSAFLSEPISLVKDNLDTSFSSAFQFRIPNAAGLEDSDGAGAD